MSYIVTYTRTFNGLVMECQCVSPFCLLEEAQEFGKVIERDYDADAGSIVVRECDPMSDRRLMPWSVVGDRIQLARKQSRLTQSDLGKLLSRPRTYAAVSDIERGKTKIDLDLLQEIAVITGKKLDWFLKDRHGEMVAS